jgi:uncharacterized protein YecE (DUF72 family)
MDWRIGTIGFGYADWSGVFYPQSLKSSDYLSYYAQNFSAVELDTTFHAIPDARRLQQWAETVDDDFRFCLKCPRSISHDLPLDRQLDALLDFVSLSRHLGSKLGPILIQYPPTLSVDLRNLHDVLQYLPPDVDFAIEFRHASWHTPATHDLLREMHVCLVAADYAGESRSMVPTTDWLFLRLLGWHNRFEKHDHEQVDTASRELRWTDELKSHLDKMKRAWVFIGDDFSGYAIAPARRLAKMLGATLREPRAMEPTTLFG